MVGALQQNNVVHFEWGRCGMSAGEGENGQIERRREEEERERERERERRGGWWSKNEGRGKIGEERVSTESNYSSSGYL